MGSSDEILEGSDLRAEPLKNRIAGLKTVKGEKKPSISDTEKRMSRCQYLQINPKVVNLTKRSRA